jgi:hypothetical protein
MTEGKNIQIIFLKNKKTGARKLFRNAGFVYRAKLLPTNSLEVDHANQAQ